VITPRCRRDRPERERFVVRGLLREEHHADVPVEMPKVRGRVERIRLVRQHYRRVRGREWEPTDADWELEDIPHSPSRFRHGEPQGDVMLNDTGLLVDLLPL
jgi:hypothetical protein